ncbi:MAG: DUF6279 family lipoprotein [Methylotenera sp.]
MRLNKFITVILLALTLGACSLIKTIYSNAPEAVHWWLDGYFDFTQAQNARLKPALHKLHEWHRQTQLPLYIKHLQQMQDNIRQEKIDAQVVCTTISTIQDHLQTIQFEAIPMIVEIAPSLTDKQLAYFEKKLHKREQNWQSEWLQDSEEEQLEARLEKMIDYSEKLYGRLHKPQKSMLKQKLSNAHFKPEISYKEILRRNDDALHTIKILAKPGLSEAQQQQQLLQAFQRLRNSPNPAYQEYAELAKQRSCEIFADLHATTDDKQKQHAIAWLENLITQFKALSYTASTS